MTNKEKLIRKISENFKAKALCLEIVLPFSNGLPAETIVVPYQFIPHKMNYIEDTYDDDLIMKRNPDIKIYKFYLR